MEIWEMSDRAPVEVRQVANGYVVIPAPNYREPCGSLLGDHDRFVFQTFAELIAWMSAHFTHRTSRLSVD